MYSPLLLIAFLPFILADPRNAPSEEHAPVLNVQNPQLPSFLPAAEGYEALLVAGLADAWDAVKEGLEWAEAEVWSSEEGLGDAGLDVEADAFRKKKSVYQLLSEENKFSKFIFLVNQDPQAIDFLSDTSNSFTLFAPTNFAFPPTPAHHIPLEFGNPMSLEALHRFFAGNPGDKKGDWKRKIAVRVLHILLQYHILPDHAYGATSLAENSTALTALTSPNNWLFGSPQRLKLTPGFRPLPTIQLNFGGHIVLPDLRASNGIVHGVNRALSPPLSVMDQLYAVPWLFPVGHSQAPWLFGVTAAAVARTGLNRVLGHGPLLGRSPTRRHPFAPTGADTDTDAYMDDAWFSNFASELSPGLDPLNWTGSPAVTIFAPTNKAWARLPPRLNKWLHSPWGEWALEKLLKFHIVNGTVLYSDFVKTAALKPASEVSSDMWPRYDFSLELPSLLGGNHSLSVHVTKRAVITLPPPKKDRELAAYRMWVQGQEVALLDIVARNGAIQGIGRVLNPLKKKEFMEGKECEVEGAYDDEDEEEDGDEMEDDADEEEDGEWDGWEDWFVKWAMAA